MSIFTKLKPTTTAEHEFMARTIDIRYNDYIDYKNKQNLLNYFTKKFMIERGLQPAPKDPRLK